MITWFKSISSGYLWIAIGAFCLIVLAYIGLLKYQINSLKLDLAKSEAQTIILSNDLETQNKAIELQAKDTASKLALSAQLVKKQQDISLSRLGKINALKAQLGNKELSCEQAVELSKGKL